MFWAIRFGGESSSSSLTRTSAPARSPRWSAASSASRSRRLPASEGAARGRLRDDAGRGNASHLRRRGSPLREADRWLDQFRHFWAPHLDALATEVARGRRQRRPARQRQGEDIVIDVTQQIRDVERRVGSRSLEAGPTRTVTISQTYGTDIDDLWDACTNPERIPRWFLPITGELGSAVAISSRATRAGRSRSASRRNGLFATWEIGGDVNWIEVRLARAIGADATRARAHRARRRRHVDAVRSGRRGIGWDMALIGLVPHLASGDPVDRESAMAWMTSEAGRNSSRRAARAGARRASPAALRRRRRRAQRSVSAPPTARRRQADQRRARRRHSHEISAVRGDDVLLTALRENPDDLNVIATLAGHEHPMNLSSNSRRGAQRLRQSAMDDHVRGSVLVVETSRRSPRSCRAISSEPATRRASPLMASRRSTPPLRSDPISSCSTSCCPGSMDSRSCAGCVNTIAAARRSSCSPPRARSLTG